MHRPILYVDLLDICKVFKTFSEIILDGKVTKENDSLHHIINVMYPEPVTILELAEMIRNIITELTNSKICPPIEIIEGNIIFILKRR